MIRNYRRVVQAVSLSLLVLIPVVNFYFDWTFLQGWYQSLAIGDLWFVSPLEGLETILITRTLYGPLLAAMVIPVVVAMLLGRVFCSWVCPINTLQAYADGIVDLVRRQKTLVRRNRWLLPRWSLFAVLIAEVVVAMVLGAPLWVFLSPPGLVGRELMMAVFYHTVALEGMIIVVVLAANFVTSRFFCRYLCPLGGMLALLGLKRRLQVRIDASSCTHCSACDEQCPLGLVPSEGMSQSSTCWNCGTCVDSCPSDSLAFRWRQRHSVRGTNRNPAV